MKGSGFNQEFRWIPSKTEDGVAMMILQYTHYDPLSGTIGWMNVPFVHENGNPVTNEDLDEMENEDLY